MRCAVANGKYVWFFEAPDKKTGRRIANTILFFEKNNLGKVFSGFNLENGYWQATPIEINEEIKKWLTKTNKDKTVEIKKRRPPTIDVLYLTRAQKERWPKEDAKKQ